MRAARCQIRQQAPAAAPRAPWGHTQTALARRQDLKKCNGKNRSGQRRRTRQGAPVAAIKTRRCNRRQQRSHGRRRKTRQRRTAGRNKRRMRQQTAITACIKPIMRRRRRRAIGGRRQHAVAGAANGLLQPPRCAKPLRQQRHQHRQAKRKHTQPGRKLARPDGQMAGGLDHETAMLPQPAAARLEAGQKTAFLLLSTLGQGWDGGTRRIKKRDAYAIVPNSAGAKNLSPVRHQKSGGVLLALQGQKIFRPCAGRRQCSIWQTRQLFSSGHQRHVRHFIPNRP